VTHEISETSKIDVYFFFSPELLEGAAFFARDFSSGSHLPLREEKENFLDVVMDEATFREK